MGSEETIFDFLTQPENLPVALEVAEYVEQLKHDLHKKFWSIYNPQMAAYLKGSEYAEGWHYNPHPARRYRTDWGKSYLAPIIRDGSKLSQLQVVFGQGSRVNGFRFFWGVRWNVPPEEFDHPGMTTLKSELINRNMTHVEDYWPGWGWYKYSPYESDFMQKIYREPTSIVDEITQDVWQLFVNLRPVLESIHETLIEEQR